MSRLLFESQDCGRANLPLTAHGQRTVRYLVLGSCTGPGVTWTGDLNLDENVQEINGVVGHVSDDDEMQ